MSDKTISLAAHAAAKDKKEKRERFLDKYILMRRNQFLFPLSGVQVTTLLASSFEEKESYVRSHQRRVMTGIAVVVLLWLSYRAYRHFVPAPIPPAPPLPTFEVAGILQDVQLHSTTFTTETTVKTSTGIFQVRGGVSASVGDTAQIKRETGNGMVQSSLCIQSQIKSRCYLLL